MSEQLSETRNPPPLAWDDEGQPFMPPEPAICWRARHYTGKPGRPPAVWTPKGVLHLPLDATIDDLRLAVSNQPGSYRLYPVDAQGRELAPVACIELMPDDLPGKPGKNDLAVHSGVKESMIASDASATLITEVAGRFFDLYERTLVSRDSHDALLANLLTTLVTTTATIQQSTARLLGAANTTIKIANGVEAIERPESPTVELNADELAAKLTEALGSTNAPQSDKPPWIMSLLNGPIGMTLMQVVAGFMSAIRPQQAPSAQPSRPEPAAQAASEPAQSQTAPGSQAQTERAETRPSSAPRARRRIVLRRPRRSTHMQSQPGKPSSEPSEPSSEPSEPSSEPSKPSSEPSKPGQ